MSNISNAAKHIQTQAGTQAPAMAIVLGSGLGDLATQISEPVKIPFEELDGFPISRVSGHSGALISGTLGGARVILLSGRVHYYEQGNAQAMLNPIATMAELGCEVMTLSNAAGSTRKDMGPGSLMAISDHIDWSGQNPLIGIQGDDRFVPMANAYDADLRARLQKISTTQGHDLRAGVYAWFSGPSFETPAEIRMIRMLGADAVGMSTVPETILARYHGMKVAAVSAITNHAAGMSDEILSHAHTKAQADKLKGKFINLITEFAGSFA